MESSGETSPSGLGQPGPIMSGPPEGEKPKNNASKFFGHSSRSASRGSASSFQNTTPSSTIASNPNTPQFFSEAMASNPTPVATVNTMPGRKKIPIIPIAIGVVAIIVVAIIIAVILSNRTGDVDISNEEKAGEVNVFALFDKNAPVPISNGTAYGYKDPTSGEWLIEPKYEDANQFYGNYAKITYNGKHKVINRKGEEIISVAYDKEINYDVNENVWSTDKNVYNGAMKKMNPDDTTSSYIGYGYAFVVPNIKKDESTTGIPSLIDASNGDTYYQCEKPGCMFGATNGTTDDKKYLVLSEYGKETKILKEEDKSELYKTSSSNYLTKIFEGVYVEKDKKTKEVKKYISIDNGEVKTSTNKPNQIKDTSISRSGKYYIKECEDNTYKIENTEKEEVVGCNYSRIGALSTSTYKKALEDGKELVILQDDQKTYLFDMKTKKNVKEYDIGDLMVYDDSSFISIYVKGNTRKYCNVLDPGIDCKDIEAKNVEVFSTFINASGTYYSYNLTEIKEGAEK